MRTMKLWILVLVSAAAFRAFSTPEETLDRLLTASYERHGLSPVERVSDEIFLRRAMIDVTGRLPKISEIRRFTADKSPDKRAKLIENLLASPRFADVAAMRLSDMFRIKSEFPINLWPNAVQGYHRFFHDAVAQNRPWNGIVRELLTASGSNFRNFAANFFRASAERTPEGLAKVTALSLMGLRINRLSADDRAKFAAFFSRIRFKSTDEWKEEIVFTDPDPVRVSARTPDGQTFEIDSPEKDPRTVFADWLTARGNPFFARAFVNRVWYWLLGGGLVDPADDLPLPPGFWGKVSGVFSSTNDNEKILDFLAEEFERSNYDIRALFALILNSRAYSADWKTRPEEQEKAEKYFAVYRMRRLEAEFLVDAWSQVLNAHEKYSSVIPEPFTFLPAGTPAVTIADGSITSRTLDNFGKPSRDAGTLEERNSRITPAQRLFLLNSNQIYQRTQQLPWRMFQRRRISDSVRIEELYLAILSRKPTAEEKKRVFDYRKSLPRKMQGRVWGDLAWALLNTQEFLYHH